MSLLLLFKESGTAPTTFGYWGISMNIDDINNKFQPSSSIMPNYKLFNKFESISYTSEITPMYI